MELASIGTVNSYEAVLTKSHPVTHTLEVVHPDGRKESMTQEGCYLDHSLIRYFHDLVDKMTNPENGTVTTKLVQHGTLHRLEVELVTNPEGNFLF